MSRSSLLLQALQHAISAAPRRRGRIGFDGPIDEAFTYSDRAIKGMAALGATGGLGYTAYQDHVAGQDMDANDYGFNALMGAGLPLGIAIEGTSLAALGPSTTYAWNRKLLRELQNLSMRGQLEEQRRRKVMKSRR